MMEANGGEGVLIEGGLVIVSVRSSSRCDRDRICQFVSICEDPQLLSLEKVHVKLLRTPFRRVPRVKENLI